MTQRNRAIVVVASAIVASVFGGCRSGGSTPDRVMTVSEREQARARLLCQANHRVLLEESRDVAKQFDAGLYVWSRLSAEEIARFPAVIRMLDPTYVSVDESGVVEIEVAAKQFPMGVRVYPEGYAKSHPEASYGDRKLLEGLWYYDQGYRDNP
jgi:hypothetical protein